MAGNACSFNFGEADSEGNEFETSLVDTRDVVSKKQSKTRLGIVVQTEINLALRLAWST